MALIENPLPIVIRQEQNQRDNQEDSFLALPLLSSLAQKPLWLLAVADGIGGRQAGEEMSRETLFKVGLSLLQRFCLEPALNTLSSTSSSALTPADLRRALQETLPLINAHIRRLAKANQWTAAGATVTLVLLLEEEVVAGNLGDSPLFHFQATTGRLIRRSQEHTIVSALMEEGLITPEMAHYHEERHTLEFFVGAESLPRKIPLVSFALASGDILLLCSDGVTGSLTETTIRNILADSNLTLNAKADYLLQAGQEAGASDNQTLILWEHQCDHGTSHAHSEVGWSGTKLSTATKKEDVITVPSSKPIVTEPLSSDTTPAFSDRPEIGHPQPISPLNSQTELKVKNLPWFITWLIWLVSKFRRSQL